MDPYFSRFGWAFMGLVVIGVFFYFLTNDILFAAVPVITGGLGLPPLLRKM
jgi:uncharacterized membrane protein